MIPRAVHGVARCAPHRSDAAAGRRTGLPFGARVTVYGPLTVLTAVAAHAGGGGDLRAAGPLLVPQVLAFLGAAALLSLVHLAGWTAGWPSVAAVTSGAQLAVHALALPAPCSPHPSAAGSHAMHHGGAMVMQAPPGMCPEVPHHGHGLDLRMLVWHLAAAVTTAVLLQWGEALVLALARAVLPHLPATRVPLMSGVRTLPVLHRATVALRGCRLGGVGRRGPPSVATTAPASSA